MMIKTGSILSPALTMAIAGWGCAGRTIQVTQWGALREVLHEGHTEPRIDLPNVTHRAHAFGVGALERLGGEITILDGDVWVARKSGKDLKMSGPAVGASDRATFLTLSHVPRWNDVELTEPLDESELEAAVEAHARRQGIDTREPFPFSIDGTVTRLESHVIAGSCPVAGTTGENTDPWRLSIAEPVKATLVGFFASGNAGVMTHRGSRVHMHVVMIRREQTMTAHVEHVELAAGGVLRLPK